jgi:hypothetical protein
MNQEEPNTNTGEETKSEEAKSETPQETAPEPVKLSDKPSDFRFHAAYLTYSDAWDKASVADVKLKLNEILDTLSNEKIDYETFYREISQYRVQSGSEHFGGGRAFIETQRKRDWRKREEKEGRNKRHGR